MTTGGVVRCRQRTLCRRRIRGRRAGMPRRTRRRRPARRRTRAGIGRRGQRHCRGICDRHPDSHRDRQRPHATDVLCVFHGWFPFAHPHRINGAVVINKGVAEWSVARCTTVHIGIGNRRRPGARRPHGPRCRVPQRSRVASRRCGRCIAVAEPRSNFDVEPIPTLFTGNPVREFKSVRHRHTQHICFAGESRHTLSSPTGVATGPSPADPRISSIALDYCGESLQMRCARGRHKGSSDAVQSPGIESGRSNGVDGSAVGLATGSQPRPRLRDQVLEPTHRALPADMFEDDQPASGCEHTPDLAKGDGHIIDRAQHKPDMDRVETVVRERNRLGDPIDDVDHNAATPARAEAIRRNDASGSTAATDVTAGERNIKSVPGPTPIISSRPTALLIASRRYRL